jgi:hypothetical protein
LLLPLPTGSVIESYCRCQIDSCCELKAIHPVALSRSLKRISVLSKRSLTGTLDRTKCNCSSINVLGRFAGNQKVRKFHPRSLKYRTKPIAPPVCARHGLRERERGWCVFGCSAEHLLESAAQRQSGVGHSAPREVGVERYPSRLSLPAGPSGPPRGRPPRLPLSIPSGHHPLPLPPAPEPALQHHLGGGAGEFTTQVVNAPPSAVNSLKNN